MVTVINGGNNGNGTETSVVSPDSKVRTETPIVVSPDSIEVKGDLGLEGNNPVVGVIYNADMIKIYSKTRLMSSSYNARGNYYNVFSTFEDIFAASPFHNFVVFTLK